MGQFLKDVHAASLSTQEAADVNFDVLPPRSNDIDKEDDPGCSKQSSSMKFAVEPTTDKVVDPAEGARNHRASGNAHDPTGGNMVELATGTSAAVNEDLAHCFEKAKEKVSTGKDIEHGHQLNHRNRSVPTSAAGDWRHAPSMNLFQEGTEEYEWWISVPDIAANSNASRHGNTATPEKSCAVFGVTPQGPRSKDIKVPVFDATPISMAPLSSGTADGPSKPQEESYVVVSSREPSPNRDEEKLKSKDR